MSINNQKKRSVIDNISSCLISDIEINKQISYVEALSILGARECEILILIGNGLTANEISIELSLSVHTVRTHTKVIKRKLNLKGYRSLIHWCKINKP